MITRPLLASPVDRDDLKKLRYPVMVSEKLDGIRCLIHPAKGPVSRQFKIIANDYIREILDQPEFHGFDGELMLRRADAEFHHIQSAVRSEPGHPDFLYRVFDDFSNPGHPFMDRYEKLAERIESIQANNIIWFHGQEICTNPEEVIKWYTTYLDKGYEGIIIRSPLAHYKSGRSSVREQFLLKMKPLKDTEGIIVGFHELFSNQNQAEEDMFGLTTRSSKRAGLVGQDTLGALVLEHLEFGKVKVGTGFTTALRDWIWRNRERLRGEKVTFSYQKIGMKNKPRFPSFQKILNVNVMGDLES